MDEDSHSCDAELYQEDPHPTSNQQLPSAVIQKLNSSQQISQVMLGVAP